MGVQANKFLNLYVWKCNKQPNINGGNNINLFAGSHPIDDEEESLNP